MKRNNEIVLSIYPNTRGFGYMCVETPRTLVRYGVVTSRPVSNDELLTRIQMFITELQPSVVVLRDCSDPSAKLANRSKQLVENIKTGLNDAGRTVELYTRKQIRDVFEILGASTKQEIAVKIAEEFPELKPHIPRFRNPWMDEGYTMGIFDAMALLITHKYLKE